MSVLLFAMCVYLAGEPLGPGETVLDRDAVCSPYGFVLFTDRRGD